MGEEDEIFTDGSVDVDDCMALFSTQSHKVVPKFEETKPIIKTAKEATKEKERYSHRNSKKKSKAMPIRGRRMKTMASKGSFSVDVKQHTAKSSPFDIQQNDIRRLEAM